MLFQGDDAKRTPGDSGGSGQESEPNPRWLPALGLAVVLTLVAALARFAIDLLGVVFLIIVVGFSLRAISDWVTETDTVSGWSIGAVVLGLAGTILVGTWLFGSSSLNRGAALSSGLPAPVVSTIDWLEARGWGQRVLLHVSPDPGPARHAHARSAETGSGELGSPPTPVEGPTFSLRAPSARPISRSHRRSRDSQEPGAADAATLPASPAAPAPPTRPVAAEPVSAPEPVRTVPTVTSLTTTYDTVRVGTSVRLTATVEATAGEELPAGDVVFHRGSEVIGTVRLRTSPEGAVAILSTLDLDIGVHEISAEYTGGDGFDASRSPVIHQTVRRQ